MSRRYFSTNPITTPAVTLGDAEAHHLLHVLRAEPGTRVVLFDGSGCEFDAEVTACARAEVELAIVQRRAVSRELPFELTLGVPLPKGDRQRWIVEKAVELGVTRLVPLRTERSGATGDNPSDKLSRYVVEASKQCGRNRLMHIERPHEWGDWLRLPIQSRAPSSPAPRQWLAVPDAAAISPADMVQTRTTFIAVGPEGGLAHGEIEAAEGGAWQPVSLGPRILRVETAAIALAAIVAVGNTIEPKSY